MADWSKLQTKSNKVDDRRGYSGKLKVIRQKQPKLQVSPIKAQDEHYRPVVQPNARNIYKNNENRTVTDWGRSIGERYEPVVKRSGSFFQNGGNKPDNRYRGLYFQDGGFATKIQKMGVDRIDGGVVKPTATQDLDTSDDFIVSLLQRYKHLFQGLTNRR